MTELVPPGYLQNAGNTHTAQQMRLYAGATQNMWGFSSSFTVPVSTRPYLGGMSVLAHTPNDMSVDVTSGSAFIKGTENTHQGLYAVYNDATKNLIIGTADPSLARIDIVIGRVRDSFYSGATNNWTLEVVQGTPSGSPTPPTVPANSVVLAQVTVGAAVTTITSANINTDPSVTIAKFTSAVGGFEIVKPNKSVYDFEGSPLWVNDIQNDGFWFQSTDGSNWYKFLTSFDTGLGIQRGAIYQGSGTLYSGTVEGLVNSLTVGPFDTDSPSGFSSAWMGRVNIRVASTVANDIAKFVIHLDTTTGAQIAEHFVPIPATGIFFPANFNYYWPGDGTTRSFVITCLRQSGTGNITVVGNTSNNRLFHILEQIQNKNFVTV